MEAETAVPLRQQHQEQLQRHRKVRPSGGQSDTASGDLGDPQTFKFALTVASTHPYSIAAQDFAKIVEEKSGGNMKVELYYDGSLGGDNELMDAMQMNGVTFALMGPAGVQTLCPMYNFFDLASLVTTVIGSQ